MMQKKKRYEHEQGQTGIALLKFRETRLQLYVSSSCDESVTILGPNLWHNMESWVGSTIHAGHAYLTVQRANPFSDNYWGFR